MEGCWCFLVRLKGALIGSFFYFGVTVELLLTFQRNTSDEVGARITFIISWLAVPTLPPSQRPLVGRPLDLGR